MNLAYPVEAYIPHGWADESCFQRLGTPDLVGVCINRIGKQ